MRANKVKQALKAGKPSVGTWLSLGSITAARFMARAGFGWLTIDMEHSLVGWETATHMFAAIAEPGCVALNRVPANRHDHIKRALDNGAQGVVVPMVNSRQEAIEAVAACKYPPVGNRSVGGSVHALNYDANPNDYYARANDEILVVLQCEHIQSVENADSIFSVPGIDAIFVGPNGLAASMRSKDARAPASRRRRSHEAHSGDLQEARRGAGLHCGAIRRREPGSTRAGSSYAIASELHDAQRRRRDPGTRRRRPRARNGD